MDRKKFIRNIAGTIAAVTLAPYIPVPESSWPSWVANPGIVTPSDRPGIGGTTFYITVKKEWFKDTDHIGSYIAQY